VRRRAVSRINDTLRGPRPIVLTCRSADYVELLATGAPVLLRAPVVQVQALSPQDIADYLRTTDDRPHFWTAVIDHVKANATSPLTTALSTPLMLSLFISGFRTADPAPLLSDPELDNRLAMEDRLVDVLADSMNEANQGQGRQWLTYLAEQLHSHDTRDLSWWRLADWAPPLGLGAVILLAGLVLAISTAVVAAMLPTTSSIEDIPSWGVGVVAMIALGWASSGNVHYAGPATRNPGMARRRFVRLLVEGNGAIAALGVGFAVVIGLSSLGTKAADVATEIGTLIGVTAGVGLVVGLGNGLHGYWAARGHRLAVTTPLDLLRQERTSSLVAAAVVTLLVGLSTVPAATWGGTAGGHLGQQLAAWLGQPVVLDHGFPGVPAHVPWRVDQAHLPALIWASAVVGLVAGGCVLLARPWARFGLARMTLAAMRRLPLRLVAFLEQAHEHELLRVSGESYQFWHIRMQERLVATAAPEAPPSTLRKMWPSVTAGVISLAAIVVLIMIGTGQPPACPDTRVAELDQVASRVAAGGKSACLGLVSDSTALGLPAMKSDNIFGGSAAFYTYLVVGEFDRMTSQQRAALPIKRSHPGVAITYVELSDPIPSVGVVPELTRELMETKVGTSWREGPIYGMTALVVNGEVRVVRW
jgi:hypothetical protein